MNKQKFFSALIVSLSLAACGGGGSEADVSSGAGSTSSPVTASGYNLSGEAAIGGTACLYADGKQVYSQGKAACATVTNGQFALSATGDSSSADASILLVVNKDGSVASVSYLGSWAQITGAAQGGTVTKAQVSGLVASEASTALYALLDTDGSGSISAAEAAVGVTDIKRLQQLTAVLKAAQGPQGASLAAKGTSANDLLSLAMDAADGTLSATGQSLSSWADANTASMQAASGDVNFQAVAAKQAASLLNGSVPDVSATVDSLQTLSALLTGTWKGWDVNGKPVTATYSPFDLSAQFTGTLATYKGHSTCEYYAQAKSSNAGSQAGLPSITAMARSITCADGYREANPNAVTFVFNAYGGANAVTHITLVIDAVKTAVLWK